MRLAFVLALLVAATTANGEGWLCVAESASGFRYNKSTYKWQPQIFTTSEKYVIKKPSPEDGTTAKWVVKQLGQDFVSANCEGQYESSELGWLECTGIVNLKFSKESLRMIAVRDLFAIRSPKQIEQITKDLNIPASDNIDDVVMEIGRCTAL